MALTLTLRPKQDVFVADEQVVLAQIVTEDLAVLETQPGVTTEVTPDHWSTVAGLHEPVQVMLAASRDTDRERNLLEVRIQFSAPGKLILRGDAYRDPARAKKGKSNDDDKSKVHQAG
jgi:hypothetical protein